MAVTVLFVGLVERANWLTVFCGVQTPNVAGLPELLGPPQHSGGKAGVEFGVLHHI